MNRRISEFYEKLFKNPVIKKNLELKMKDIKTEDELKKLIKEEIIPFVQKMEKILQLMIWLTLKRKVLAKSH